MYLRGMFAKRRFIRAAANQAKPHATALLSQPLNSIDQQMLPFGRSETADAEDFKGVPFRCLFRRREELRIDAKTRDDELIPVDIEARAASTGCGQRS